MDFKHRDQLQGALFLGAIVTFCTWIGLPRAASAHPVFNTPLTGGRGTRPALQVEIIDPSEVFSTAELYLTVQSSRSPQSVCLLFPLNRGDFQGLLTRYIQLPFEVQDGDVLLLNLLDEDRLTDAQEKLVIDASRSAGYCLVVAGSYIKPEIEKLIKPAFMSSTQVLGDGVVLQLRENPFENMGIGEFIAQSSRPDGPNQANRVTLIDMGKRARAQVRVYYPPQDFSPATGSR